MTNFGFKGEYCIDIGESAQLYFKNKREYEPSHCYNNAFHCLTVNFSSRSKAIIGYVMSTDGVRKCAVRHAWNEINGRKVDVTMFANDANPMSVMTYRYLPVMVMDNAKFIKKIEANNCLPCLPIDDKEKKLRETLKKKGFEVLD